MTDYIVNYKIYSNTEELADQFAILFKKRVGKLLGEKENIFIALSGGVTPGLYLSRLSAPEFSQDIIWKRIHFFWVDERMVPPTDQGSNYHAIKEVLINKIPIPEENIHRIKGEIVPQLEVKRYGNEIVNNVSNKHSSLPEFDWILLGMGKDGHTASIFPETQFMEEYEGITAISRFPETGQIRITLTEAIINNADNVTFVIAGKDKAEMVHEILRGDKDKYPAGRINPTSGSLEFLIDKDAASLII
jgi:6-phosphogluconolactonase